MPLAATWMDLEIVILGEVSQEEKDKYILPLICVILKKMVQMILFTKQKSTHRCKKTNSYWGGEAAARGRDKLGDWD